MSRCVACGMAGVSVCAACAPKNHNVPPSGCACIDPDVDRLRELIAGGMSQVQASALVWPKGRAA